MRPWRWKSCLIVTQPGGDQPRVPYRGLMPKQAQALEIDAGGRAVRVSNPAKLMFPRAGITKEDLVRYYVAVGDGMLAAVRDRPLTLRRYPDGVDGESFFQNWP